MTKPNTVERTSTPLEPIALGTFVPPPEQQQRELTIANWLNIDPDFVYQPTFGGHPVLLPLGGNALRDVCPDLDATAAWWPLLWPSFDQEERYDNESDDEYALRILIDFEMRGMYDPADGTWLPSWAVWEATRQSDNSQWADRVDAWLDGDDDTDLDDLEPAPLPHGTEPDEPYVKAQLRIDEMNVIVARAAIDWTIERIDISPDTAGTAETWERLCNAADALTPFSQRWESWFDQELARLQPVADAATVTGQHDAFDRQSAGLIETLRRELADPNPM